MLKPRLCTPSARRVTAMIARGLAVAMSVLTFASHGAQTSATFNVVVNTPAVTARGDARSCTVLAAFGVTVTVVCSPGAVRFVAVPPGGDQAWGSGLIFGDSRTALSWRRITLEHGDYFEMMVHW